MATEELIVLLDARTAKLDAKLNSTNEKLDRLTGSTKRSDDSLKSFGRTAGVAKAAVLGLAAALGVRQFVIFADTIQKAENQLRSVTDTTEEFIAIQDELRRIAGETRQSMSDLTTVYARFKRAGEEAGFTIKETLDLTEQLTKAFKIEGNTTAEVNSVLLQLTQSFRSGRIAGEEFRAVSEGSTLVLRALSSQLGVTTGELKEMAAQGLVTPEALIAGLQGAEKEINAQFKDLEPTFAEVGSAMGRVFSAAYDNSIAESTAGSLKRMLIEMGADIEFFFSGKESLSEAGLENRINDLSEKILVLKQELSQVGPDENAFFLEKRIAIKIDELEGYQERLNSLQDNTALDIDVSGEEDPRIQRERDFAMAVLEIHNEQAVTDEERFEREAEIHQLALDNKLISERDYQEAVNDSAVRYGKKKLEGSEKLAKAEQSIQGKNIQSLMAISSALLGHDSKIGKLLFLGSQALAASETIVNTQAASIKALTIDPTGVLSARVQLQGNLALAAIAATTFGSLAGPSGGGGGGGGGGGTGSIGSQPQRERDFQPETTSLELTASSLSGSSTNTINFATDSGDELMDTIAKLLNKGQKEGRFT
jgi:tape measure domain-containing protein